MNEQRHFRVEEKQPGQGTASGTAPRFPTPLKRKLGLGILLSVSAFSLIFLWGGSDVQTDAPAEPRLTVETIVAEPSSGYPLKRMFLGTVEAARSSQLGFELSGLVSQVLADEGETVSRGQRLAVLDTQRLQSRRRELAAEKDRLAAQLKELETGPRLEDIEQARAAVRQWEARLELAEATRKRSQEAFQLDAIAGQEWDEARLNRAAISQQLETARHALSELENGTRPERIEAQRAAVQGLRSRIDSLDVDIRKSVLRAPFAATVAGRMVDEGEVVAAGQSVLHLLEDGRLEARVGVESRQVRRLQPGQDVRLESRAGVVAAQDKGPVTTRIRAQVKAILPDRQSRTRAVEVLLTVAPGQGLRHGDLVELVLEEDVPERGFWLPMSALTESVRGLWAAYVLIPDPGSEMGYRLERRELELLTSQAERAYVRGSLRTGELVAASGVHRLVPGQLVSTERSNTKRAGSR